MPEAVATVQVDGPELHRIGWMTEAWAPRFSARSHRAEEAWQMVIEQLEELEGSHGLKASDGIGAGRQASRRPRGASSDIDGSRLTNLRRRCIETEIDPDAYEKALVQLCRTL
jgi:hypothetical protein